MRSRFLRIFAAAALTVAALNAARAETFRTRLVGVTSQTLADDLSHPWGLDFLPDGSAILTERPGRMRLFADGILSKPLQGLPKIRAGGQGGLLDVRVSPDFERSHLIYFTYSQPGEGGAGTAVARARLVRGDGPPRLADVEVIFSMARRTRGSLQFGSRIVFAPDGTLFVTIGDRGQADRAQDKQDSAGKVLRMNPDGSAPKDNPFLADRNALPQLWSLGHRNAEGAVFDPVTKSLWAVEHGARGGDEVNRPEAGRNYGWPVISYGVNYDGSKIGVGTAAPGYEQPEFYWDPSIAPSGMAVYTGSMFPEWKGDFLIGALKFELVSRLERSSDGRKITGEERMFAGAFGRIRSIDVAPDGSVWLLTDEDDGRIIRLSREE